MKKLLIIVNSAEFFLSHRLPVAEGARRAGFDVHISTPPGEGVQAIKDLGFKHHPVSLTRSGQNFREELHSLVSLYQVIRRVRPEIVHLVTIKPVLYGGLVSRLMRVPACVVAISGLGVLFANRRKNNISRHLVKWWYRLALKHPNSVVIFQNSDDKQVLQELKAVRDEQVRYIRGSGVNLDSYSYHAEPSGIPVITMAARLLREKGVREFVEAARILAQRQVSVEFRLIGAVDPGNPQTITNDELEKWREISNLKILGFRDDVTTQYASSHIVTLPSYYGEGLPKSLIEAAACGRAVVTTDMPGCRDAIEPGKTGLLVPAKNAEALADAIEYLIKNPDKRKAMGLAGRNLAEREFAIEKVVSQHIEFYRELESNIG